MQDNRFIPTTLSAKNKPGWAISAFRKVFRIEPETYEQDQKIEFTSAGIVRPVRTKSGRSQFGEISGSANQFVIERPSARATVDPAKALANNRGFVYAAVNAKAREIMVIDWRLFEVDGKDHKEQESHDVLDLLDAVNDNMIGLELKYLTSACLDLTGNCYWYMEGVKGDLDKPKALHLMPPDKVRPVIDRRSWPYQLVGYKMKLDTTELAFQPYEVIHFRLPNPGNFFEGMSPTQAAAEYIDNDNYAQEFNRNFFQNGARPAGFLETEMVNETQIETLKISFADLHQGIENMNRIGVLPKGVKWSANGVSPKDMDFKNLSDDGKDRTLAMFGVSRTILGTAESDTNRATAETADYVFSKRVVKPHMMLICATLNEKLIPRYGDNLYITFIDPVPEDRAARTTEMQVSTGSQPILTVNEARDEFMGLGPVDGGDVLMTPTTMQPTGAPADPDGDVDPDAEGNPQNADKAIKSFEPKGQKAVNGLRVAFRPVRVMLQSRAKQRHEMSEELAKRIAESLKEKLSVKQFDSTKEKDEAVWKAFSERTHKAEQEIAEGVQKLNDAQKKEVLEHLPAAIEKAIDPTKLFDLDNWISITTDVLSPILTALYEDEAKAAIAEVGKPDIDPFTDIARSELHSSIALMARSYQTTVRDTLEKLINSGLESGQSLADMSSAIGSRYEDLNGYAAERIAKTESFRTSNAALKQAWKQSGVVKTIKWYCANAPCPFCQQMEGKTIGVDDNFLTKGDTLTTGSGDDAQSMSIDYADVSAPPLHPNCMCMARPETVSLE